MEQYNEKDFPDALFRRKLEDHEEQVNEEVWKRLNGQLEAGRKTLWRDRRLHAAAAVVLLLLGARLWLGDGRQIEEHQLAGEVQQIGSDVVPPAASPLATISDDSPDHPIVRQEVFAKEVEKTVRERAPEHIAEGLSLAPPQELSERSLSPEKSEEDEGAPEPQREVSATRVLVVHVTPALLEESDSASEENVITPEQTLAEADVELPKERKRKGINRFFKQLKNAKTGEKIDWDELGINPQRVLANVETASPEP
jgi:hypothetical protein